MRRKVISFVFDGAAKRNLLVRKRTLAQVGKDHESGTSHGIGIIGFDKTLCLCDDILPRFEEAELAIPGRNGPRGLDSHSQSRRAARLSSPRTPLFGTSRR